VSEDHKIIPASGKDPVRNRGKRNKCFSGYKNSPNNIEKLYHVLHTIKPTPVEPGRAFSAIGLFAIELENRLNDDSMLRHSYVNIIKISKKLPIC